MDLQIATILLLDGMASGAIYTMLALGFVLVFTTTRIIFASYGDLIASSVLTMHALQQGRLPGTAAMLAMLAVLATLSEVVRLTQGGETRRIPRAILVWLLLPLAPALISLLLRGEILHPAAQIALTIALVVPIAPLLHRVVFQPIETASTLTLLIVALVLHYLYSGLTLLFFGPEGIRTAPLLSGSIVVFGLSLSVQLVAVLLVAAILSLALALFFSATLTGKALRATAYNRNGAGLVGISIRRSGSVAFILAGVIAAVIGILIGPTVTIYYDSGLMIGLKGFVGAVLGGFVSYPLATVGSLLVGLVEAYASFFASSYKEIIVFLAVVPIVLLRWLSVRHEVEDEEEELA